MYQPDFLPDEPRSRWKKVFDKIGGDAVAVVQGAPQTNPFDTLASLRVYVVFAEVGETELTANLVATAEWLDLLGRRAE